MQSIEERAAEIAKSTYQDATRNRPPVLDSIAFLQEEREYHLDNLHNELLPPREREVARYVAMELYNYILRLRRKIDER